MQEREEESATKKDQSPHDPQSENTLTNTNLSHGTLSAGQLNEGNQNILPQDQKKAIADVPSLSSGVHRLAKLWIRLLTLIASIIFAGVLSAVVGFGTWTPPPAFDLVQRYPIVSVVIASLFVLISFFAWFVSRKPTLKENAIQPNKNYPQYPRRLVIAVITSTTSSILCFTLIAVILIRPPWCPMSLCPAPKLILNPNGIHDSNIEFYFQTIQSPFYTIPDNPASYTLKDLPKDTSALQIDDSTKSPYRVVLGIHSLQQGRFGLIIEQVFLEVKQVTLVPYPLRVWTEGEQRDFHSNVFQLFYNAQEAGTLIMGIYSSQPYGHVQLVPGESDELDLQVVPRISMGIDLHFRVQLTYRVANKPQLYTLTLPRIFEVIFSNHSDWFQYHLDKGRFVPGS